MRYQRHIVQYNDLVFDRSAIIAESVFPTSFKDFSSDYTFTHGAYSPSKSEYPLCRPKSVSVSVKLFLKDIPCEYRDFYKSFILTQLSKNGKLWSVENNTLEWAFAKLQGLNEDATVKKNQLEFDVDFYLPEGVWHKADKTKTFLFPYDRCTFMDCYDYEEIQPCYTGDCCHCVNSETISYCNCCECEQLTKEMALCYQAERGCCKDGLQFLYECDARYRIVYNCAMGRKFFGNYYGVEHYGTKICSLCGHISGKFYSETEIPTRGVTLTIHGSVTNPVITINGNTNMIRGTFEELVIYPDMSAYKIDCCEIPVDVDDIVIPKGNQPGWEIVPGTNRIFIDGICCDTACVYIEVDALTI